MDRWMDGWTDGLTDNANIKCSVQFSRSVVSDSFPMLTHSKDYTGILGSIFATFL